MAWISLRLWPWLEIDVHSKKPLDWLCKTQTIHQAWWGGGVFMCVYLYVCVRVREPLACARVSQSCIRDGSFVRSADISAWLSYHMVLKAVSSLQV